MTLRRRILRIVLILLLLPPILAGIAGWLVAPNFLHPFRRELTPDLVREAEASFAQSHSVRQDFDVRAPDGIMLRGWMVRPANPNGNWVLLLHGVADNRIGVVSHSEFLLRAGYSVLMMDARAHGASEGPMATYGWLERNDTKATIDALLALVQQQRTDLQIEPGQRPPNFVGDFHGEAFHPPPLPTPHIFALGESMGAGIALQSAAADPRIEAVVAEASFASLHEASFDYAGLRRSPFLGKTLFRPFSWMLIYRAKQLTGLPVDEVSPEKAAAARPFPVLLICDEKDEALPCRHSEGIYASARGPRQLWEVPNAFHTAALGFQPVEFQHRVLEFFANVAQSKPVK